MFFNTREKNTIKIIGSDAFLPLDVYVLTHIEA